ncbi:sensor of ECF-type sigma factor [Polaribacter sp. Z014]|uniref:sensor of ECF-type sigma factor n=1 Tax=unclassified Polaribacter TaxID=196858 RepID=UPI00193B2110|nr:MULTISPECIES: sensor of ECF-type sigma factor [unclassified Polaribacter]MCL7765224.1 sensor of ECF-type sigma factor [Polaribacter sp. Z014]QVY67043.1 sensor of ECF-type sigma factor [Polaribacter sp. Q13]
MKKIITLICIGLFCTLTSSAQNKNVSREKIKALKVSYITEQLSLTSNEAEKFWPIYNLYIKEQYSLRNNLRSKIKNATKEEDKMISENEAETLILLKLTIDKKIYESQRDFINNIKKVISYKKIVQLQFAEMEFGRKLMNKYKHKKANSKN